jgi:hypothetical protein
MGGIDKSAWFESEEDSGKKKNNLIQVVDWVKRKNKVKDSEFIKLLCQLYAEDSLYYK